MEEQLKKQKFIPKVIHYCWFGPNPLPPSARKYIRSWRKYCPDYTIREWNERNFDINCNAYCREMARRQKWAFLTDYVRLKIIYENGGIYLDTDVQLLKSLEPLRRQGPYMGRENTGRVATGLGFAAEAGNPLIRANMLWYEQADDFDQVPSCPYITTEILRKHGMTDRVDRIQIIDGMYIYPEEYLCPKNERNGLITLTENSYSIHQFDASWFEPEWKESQKKRWQRERRKYILQTPNRLLMRILGEKRYAGMKSILKKKKQD